MPVVVSTPPINVVFCSPSLSTKIPDIGEKRKVAPIVRDPTRAAYIEKENKQKIKMINFASLFYWG